MDKIKFLFVCDYAQCRSRTAAEMFYNHPRIEAKCCGVDKNARIGLSKRLVEWADVVVVFATHQKLAVHKKNVETPPQVYLLALDDVYGHLELDLQLEINCFMKSTFALEGKILPIGEAPVSYENPEGLF